MKVPYNYLDKEFQNTTVLFSEWSKLIKSNEFTLGKYVYKLESQLRKYLNTKYVVSVNNGTDALLLALKSINVGQNDEVLLPTNTFYATAGAIVATGAKPIFVDVDDRYQICLEDLFKKISPKTKAIIPVHWGGASPDVQYISNKLKKYKNKIYIVEDACMGLGGKYKNKKPGTIGDIGAYSFHPLKTVNAIGDGGFLTIKNKRVYDWCVKYRNHGMKDRDHIDIWGLNMRMQPLQCVVVMEGLKKLDKLIFDRNQNAKILDQILSSLYPNVIIPQRPPYEQNTFCLYMVRVKKRNKLIRYLNKNKIETKIHYPIPLHLQKAAKDNVSDNFTLPKSESQAKDLLTLPVHQYLTKKQVIYMANKIKKFYF